MKILLVLPLEPWFKGGVENVVKEYSTELKKHHQLTLVCTSTKLNQSIVKKTWNEISVIICKSYIDVLRLSPILISYIRKNAKFYDILVIHNYSKMIPAELLYFRKDISVPIVFTPHFHSKGSTISLQMYRMVYDLIFRKFFLPKIDAFHFVSQAERAEFIRKFPITKINLVIYNGINVEKFNGIIKDKERQVEQSLLFVGRLEKYKNIEYVIRSLEFLPDTYKLYIIGKGPYRANLERVIVNRKLEKRVVLLGSVSDEDYVMWMKNTSLFIHPSTIESFGLTALEAIASGLKCVVNTQSYGLQELAALFKKEIIGMKMEKGKEKELANIIKE